MSKRLEIYKRLVEKDQIYNIDLTVFSIDESFIFF